MQEASQVNEINEYLEYGYKIFQELKEYSRKMGDVDYQFIEIMMDKIVSPYVYWRKEPVEKPLDKPSVLKVSQDSTDEMRINHLRALCKNERYRLEERKGDYYFTKSISKADFPGLRQTMEKLGFEYVKSSGGIKAHFRRTRK